MNTVSLVQFRRDAGGVLGRVKRGQQVVLTVRGKPVARLSPVEGGITKNDPLYRLAGLADEAGGSLTNRDIDRLVYEN
ncbi:MAG TPA: type II toxin-antitoxin system prevent-host-death family antitoxin [Kiritimatiellia bacterium]|nr:type II toxin-antitoxin system prevent-host-death family antitoxin [Kiritimatiellia bacterium]